MANALTVDQIYQVVNSIVEQATGKAQITPTNTSEFVAVAQTGLLTGTEPLMSAVSQMLSRTIISTRPYTRKFKGLEADTQRYGNHVRKVNYVDDAWEQNPYVPIATGQDCDQQKPTVPTVVQTNFYGQSTEQIPWTIFREQILTAFTGPEELNAFVTGKVTNISDQVEQKHENLARACIANLIGGISKSGNAHQVVHLLTEYNTQTGLALTATTMYQPENFAPFMRWVEARIKTVRSLLTERTMIYHTNITDKPIMRHTPESMQRIFLYSPEMYNVDANALAVTFNDNRVEFPTAEVVNFWQSINSPKQIQVKPTYMQADGTLTTPEDTVTVDNIFGVIMDEEAAGYTVIDHRTTSAPYNGKYEFQNFWQKFNDRYWNDFTENAVLLTLD